MRKKGRGLGLRLGLGLSLISFCPSPSLSLSLSPSPSIPTKTATEQEALLDAVNDRVINRVFVPSAQQKVGEVRLIARGRINVVQTLLYSKLLSRVVGEIRTKEMTNWPPDRSGHQDAVRYTDTLSMVQKKIWERLPANDRLGDRRQRMLIEFVLSERDALVMVGSFEMSESGTLVTVTHREPIATLPLSRAYIKQNMRLIAADSFRLREAAIDALMEQLPLLQGPAVQ